MAPSLRLDAGFTVKGEAARLWRELRPGEVDLCGLSLGALVALRAALDESGCVRRLALCAGFAVLPRPLSLLQSGLGALAALLPGRFRGELGGLDRATIRAIFREGRRFDIRSELGRLTMPVLVLVGEKDRANRGLSRVLADALGAELYLVPGAGHVANLDAPEAFNQALRAFLDEDAPAPSSPRRP